MINPSEIIALGFVLPLLDVAIVATRCRVKTTRVRGFALDDGLILLSLACACATAALMLDGTITAGYGRVSPPAITQGGDNANASHEITVTRHLTWSIICINSWTYGLAKLSVLVWYRSIFVGRVFNILSILLIVAVSIWTLGTFLVVFLQCGSEYREIWTNAAYVAKHCDSGFVNGTAIAATDVFTDLVILVLPIYWVLKLKLPLKKRLSVMGVFFFGALTIAASIIRLVAVSLVYPGHNSNPNQYAYMTTLVYYGQLEAGLCVIAASLPTLGPLLFTKRSHSATSRMKNYMHDIGHQPRLWFGSKRTNSTDTPVTTLTTSTTELSLSGGSKYKSFTGHQDDFSSVRESPSSEHINKQGKDEILVTRSFHIQSEAR